MFLPHSHLPVLMEKITYSYEQSIGCSQYFRWNRLRCEMCVCMSACAGGINFHLPTVSPWFCLDIFSLGIGITLCVSGAQNHGPIRRNRLGPLGPWVDQLPCWKQIDYNYWIENYRLLKWNLYYSNVGRVKAHVITSICKLLKEGKAILFNIF